MVSPHPNRCPVFVFCLRCRGHKMSPPQTSATPNDNQPDADSSHIAKPKRVAVTAELTAYENIELGRLRMFDLDEADAANFEPARRSLRGWGES